MQTEYKISCPSCRAQFTSEANLNRHRGAKFSPCREARRRAIEERLKLIPDYDHRDPEQIPFTDEPTFGLDDDGLGTDSMAVDEDWYQETTQASGVEHAQTVQTEVGMDVIEEPSEKDSNNLAEQSPNPHAPTIQKCHLQHQPNRSQSYGKGITTFEHRRQSERAAGKSVYGDFRSADVFELAELMLTSQMSQRTESKLLRTKIVCLFLFSNITYAHVSSTDIEN